MLKKACWVVAGIWVVSECAKPPLVGSRKEQRRREITAGSSFGKLKGGYGPLAGSGARGPHQLYCKVDYLL